MSGWGGDYGSEYGFLPHRETVTHRAFLDSRAQITEHRAPTDESVRLLREMEQAAETKFKNGIRLEGNDFNAVVSLRSLNFVGEIGAVCLFDFNGERIEVEASVTRMEVLRDRYAIVFKLRDEVAKAIASRCLEKAFLPVMDFFR